MVDYYNTHNGEQGRLIVTTQTSVGQQLFSIEKRLQLSTASKRMISFLKNAENVALDDRLENRFICVGNMVALIDCRVSPWF